MSGIFAECTSAIFYVPAENISQRLQIQTMPNIQRYRNANDIIKTTLHYEGVKGLYRGYLASLYTNAPGSAVWWTTYELTKMPLHQILNHYSTTDSHSSTNNHIVHIISGGLSGFTSCIVSNPLDVVKTRLQTLDVRKDTHRSAIENGIWPLFFSIVRKEGLKGLYKGLTARLMINIPGSSLAFFFYEIVKRYSLSSLP
jgi:hypothetical protein